MSLEARTTTTPDKLVAMANQIGLFFVSQKQGDAATAIAAHLEKFWDPSMRRRIVAHLAAGGAGLDETVRAAVARLKAANPET